MFLSIRPFGEASFVCELGRLPRTKHTLGLFFFSSLRFIKSGTLHKEEYVDANAVVLEVMREVDVEELPGIFSPIGPPPAPPVIEEPAAAPKEKEADGAVDEDKQPAKQKKTQQPLLHPNLVCTHKVVSKPFPLRTSTERF